MIVNIGCSSSSGSTFFSALLNRHPEIACGDELYIFCKPLLYRDYAHFKRIWAWGKRRGLASHPHDANRSLFINLESYDLTRDRVWEWALAAPDIRGLAARFEEHIARLTGKPIWAEKSPQNIKLIGPFLEAFPEARAIHLVRDPRDVVLSLLARGRSLLEGAEIWLTSVAAAHPFRAHPRLLEIRYEDLILAPEKTLGAVCAHVGVKFDWEWFRPGGAATDALGTRHSRAQNAWQLKPHEGFSPKSIGKWKEREAELDPIFGVKLTDAYARLLGTRAWTLAELAREHGYDVDPARVPPTGNRVLKFDGRTLKKKIREFWIEGVRYMPKVKH